jgi:hypothetical protein
MEFMLNMLVYSFVSSYRGALIPGDLTKRELEQLVLELTKLKKFSDPGH